jgi:hypothetical protein
MNCPTKKMIVPVIPKGWIIYDLESAPGLITIGTTNHFVADRINGHQPFEITWEDAVRWLNDEHPITGSKATLCRYGEWTDKNQDYLDKNYYHRIWIIQREPSQTEGDLAMVRGQLRAFAERGWPSEDASLRNYLCDHCGAFLFAGNECPGGCIEPGHRHE